MDFNRYIQDNTLIITKHFLQDINKLVSFLEKNTHITSIDISSNGIGDEGAKALANGNLTHLTTLNISSNRIGDEGAKALANGNFTHLTTLNISSNRIGDEGAKALAEFHTCNIKLEPNYFYNLLRFAWLYNNNTNKLSEDSTRNLLFDLATSPSNKEKVFCLLDDPNKYPFLINSTKNENGNILPNFFLDYKSHKKFFELGLIPKPVNTDLLNIAQNNQSVHATSVVNKTNFITKKLVESVEADKKKLETVINNFTRVSIPKLKEYQNNKVKLNLFDFSDQEKKVLRKSTRKRFSCIK